MSLLDPDRPAWFRHRALRPLFALERVWSLQATRLRESGVRLVLLPDPACLEDADGAPLVMARCGESWTGTVRCAWPQLPFADGSVDQVVVQHVLEDAESAPALFAECVRVLSDDGELLVFGLNPGGSARLRCTWSSRRPRRVRLPGRLREALVRFGLVVAPPLGLGSGRVEAVPAPKRFLRPVYVLRARKHIARVIPLRASMRRHAQLPAALQPSQCAQTG